jgi:LysR family cyn operon transcriptional activator
MKDASSIELRHLRAFLTVAETRNFTRAAERLGVSQPSISIQIRELETALGTQLFHRLGQGIVLSPAGRAFHPRAALVLGKLSDAYQAVQQSEDLVAGHLSLATIPLLNVPWVPKVLGRIAREHPGLAVTVIEKSSDDVEVTVESGVSDLGLGILSRASPNLVYELLREDELVLLQGPDGPFGRKRSVTADEAGAARLVVLPESYVIRQLTNAAFRDARVLPKYAFEVDTVEAMLATVIESNLCTLMPAVVLEGRERLGMRLVKLKGWGQRYEFGLIWPGAGQAGAAALAFAKYVREFVR